MIGILLLSHGSMADGVNDAIKLIMGEQKQLFSIGLKHEDSIERFREEVKLKTIELDEGEGVIIFSDLLGASPYNITAALHNELENVNYKSIAGLNLPMVIEACSNRDEMALCMLAESAMEAGRKSIKELFNTIAKTKGLDKNGKDCSD